MNEPITTIRPPRVYVTARDAKTGRSKTITLHGNGLTPQGVIDLILHAITPSKRKAG